VGQRAVHLGQQVRVLRGVREQGLRRRHVHAPAPRVRHEVGAGEQVAQALLAARQRKAAELSEEAGPADQDLALQRDGGAEAGAHREQDGGLPLRQRSVLEFAEQGEIRVVADHGGHAHQCGDRLDEARAGDLPEVVRRHDGPSVAGDHTREADRDGLQRDAVAVGGDEVGDPARHPGREFVRAGVARRGVPAPDDGAAQGVGHHHAAVGAAEVDSADEGGAVVETHGRRLPAGTVAQHPPALQDQGFRHQVVHDPKHRGTAQAGVGDELLTVHLGAGEQGREYGAAVGRAGERGSCHNSSHAEINSWWLP
jgi:hypothetical protein